MSEITPDRYDAPTSTLTLDDAYDLLADPIRRATVRAIRGSRQPVVIERVATHVVSLLEDTTEPLNSLSPADVRMRLRHVHLPRLETAGVVRPGPTGLLGEPARSTALDRILDGIDGHRTAEDSEIDRLLEALASRRRRIVLSLLEDGDSPWMADDLAEAVAREQHDPDGAVAEEAINRIQSRLVHADLPKLADAGLIAYRGPDRPIGHRGHPLIPRLPLEAP